MLIKFHRFFEKNFKKLPEQLKKKTLLSINKFSKNPHDSKLRNHGLKGKLQGKRAFWVTGDVRVVFEQFDNYVLVIMLDVGTHNQVY
jgi:addiction module RelE/StbE family toxin